jgi:hypothetical protein
MTNFTDPVLEKLIITQLVKYSQYCDMTPESRNSGIRVDVHYQTVNTFLRRQNNVTTLLLGQQTLGKQRRYIHVETVSIRE